MFCFIQVRCLTDRVTKKHRKKLIKSYTIQSSPDLTVGNKILLFENLTNAVGKLFSEFEIFL